MLSEICCGIYYSPSTLPCYTCSKTYVTYLIQRSRNLFNPLYTTACMNIHTGEFVLYYVTRIKKKWSLSFLHTSSTHCTTARADGLALVPRTGVDGRAAELYICLLGRLDASSIRAHGACLLVLGKSKHNRLRIADSGHFHMIVNQRIK
jgi:hypothetical protein